MFDSRFMPFLGNPAPIPLCRYKSRASAVGLNKIATATAGMTVAGSVFATPASKAVAKQSVVLKSSKTEKAPAFAQADVSSTSQPELQDVDWTLFFKSLRAV